jgi:hypothetical protein
MYMLFKEHVAEKSRGKLTLMGIKNLLTLVPTIREEGSKWID